jgi:formate dehydrogenase subunit gamma
MTTEAASTAVDVVYAIVARLKQEDGPLLPILHAVQEVLGYIPQDAVRVIASELNLTRAEVHGVVTFYHDFRQQPAGRHVLKLCRAEACQSMGGEALVARAENQLGISCGHGHTTPDGNVTLEAVYCLGLCATAPAAMVDGRPVGRLTSARLDTLLKDASR